jgi:PhnB protein
MPEPTRFDQLDEAVQVILETGQQPALSDTTLTELAAVARGLSDLPRPEFKQSLKERLQRKESMASSATKVNPIPAGYNTATPYLIVDNAAAALDFYRKALGAEIVARVEQADGRIAHSEIKIGDSKIMLADEFPEIEAYSPRHYGGSPVTLLLYVEDVDARVEQAVAAGARIVRPVADQPYGDRNGGIEDPFGHRWFIATHIRDVAPAQPKPYLREGFHSLQPYLVVDGAARLIDFMRVAFGAEEKLRVPTPDGKIMHAEVRVGDSIVELADGNDRYRSSTAGLHLYVPDADSVYRRALDAGGVSMTQPVDQPYGDREGGVKDPSGNQWWIATHKGAGYMREGMRSVTPFLHPRGAGELISFLERAFGATVLAKEQSPEGTVHYASVRIGDSALEMGEAHGQYQPTPVSLHLYVPDADAVYQQALAAGATSQQPPADTNYGDRSAGVTDPFGNSWFIATYKGMPERT